MATLLNRIAAGAAEDGAGGRAGGPAARPEAATGGQPFAHSHRIIPRPDPATDADRVRRLLASLLAGHIGGQFATGRGTA